jgi:hypothetical protein
MEWAVTRITVSAFGPASGFALRGDDQWCPLSRRSLCPICIGNDNSASHQ